MLPRNSVAWRRRTELASPGVEDPFRHLTEVEKDCLRRYLSTLTERLGSNLVEVWLYGSVARGDMWSAMPNRSDIDLLVVTKSPVDGRSREELINETLPLFLECGRQIDPKFHTVAWLARPPDRQRQYADQILRDGTLLYRAG